MRYKKKLPIAIIDRETRAHVSVGADAAMSGEATGCEERENPPRVLEFLGSGVSEFEGSEFVDRNGRTKGDLRFLRMDWKPSEKRETGLKKKDRATKKAESQKPLNGNRKRRRGLWI